MSELTSDDDEETAILASATIIFSSVVCAFASFSVGLNFKATCSLVNTGGQPVVFVRSDGL